MLTVIVLFAGAAPGRTTPAAITAHQAGPHGMWYHLALPEGWTRDRAWPVLVVIPDAARAFEPNLEAFVAARGSRALLLVAPEVLTCGGRGSRTRDHYSYTPAEWNSLRDRDDYAFDDAGLAAVLSDVGRRWGGESKAFLTGWEAGGHTVWAQALRRPERWRGVAPVTTNYQRRGLDPGSFSTAPEHATLSIQVFRCGAPTGPVAAGMRFFDRQIQDALADARAHGFAPAPVRIVPGANHGPLAEAVTAWVDSLANR